MFTLINRDNSCCFSGYRPEKLPWGDDEADTGCLALKERIFQSVAGVYGEGVRHYICGMARGADMYFAEAVLRLKKERGDVTLEAAMPYPNQASRWTAEEKTRHADILTECDIVTHVSEKYAAGCMRKRNRYMVNNACLLICVYDGQPGGTGFTVSYAEKKTLDIRVLEP
jgi:uncharacterized phage-like protein YoqJ